MDGEDRAGNGGGCRVCLRCGKLVPEGDAFCTSCGSSLKGAPLPGVQGSVAPGEFEAMRRGPAPMSPAAAVPACPTPAYPAYGGAPAYHPPPVAARRTDELAIVSLVCGIGSFAVLPLVAAIAAVVTGLVSLGRIKGDPKGLDGGGLAVAGIALGIANIAVIALFVVLALMLWMA